MYSEVDFPIGFAENAIIDQDSVSFYLEWLQNSEEFPDLSSPNSNLTGGNWEFLQRKEVDQEDHILEDEDATWSKVNSSNDKKSYVEMAEKNSELTPTKRTLQPLWPTYHTPKLKDDTDEEEETTDDDDLDLNIFYAHKSQSKITRRTNRLQKLRHLREVDYYVPGLYRLATSSINDPKVTYPKLTMCKALDVHVTNKSEALIFSNTMHLKRYGTNRSYKTHKTDPSEFTIHDPITRR